MTKNKRILAISYLFPNSEQPNHGIFVLNRLTAMSKYADVTIINPIPDSPFHGFIGKFKSLKNIPETETMNGLTVYHPRFLSIPGYLKSIEINSYKRAVQKVIDTIGFDFDVVDLHWTFPDLPTGHYLSNRYDVPFNVTLRGMEAFHFQDNDVRQQVVKKYLKNVTKVISLSEEMATTANELAQTGSRTTVIRNGVDTDKFYYLDKTECRTTLGLPQDKQIILGVGALIHRKGFDLVIKALSTLTQQPKFHNLVFYILGSEGAEGDYRTELKHYVTEHNLQDHVVFQGAVANQQLITWYNAVDVFCLSSRGEGSPNVLTEALACGTPAVATKVGSVPEIMASEPDLGDVVENDDLAGLTKALDVVLSNTYDREEAAKRFNKYTWDWCAKEVAKTLAL
ncbi:glycosyltransferase [Psychrosphaera sp. 1_MG-2023]|uniref:glycosyltransferase n=1 Tax=Psychrosphaera sp. 1_MG-2023 TaxID=3062643 RepID=UPI0026E39F2E|nr:glycosyltransferase [Psychrosphaera sp. 1_MG-2023]MDO6720377.1 glycosyltransferase [Psychrosphaera sp. 1_MG-2023]